MKEEILESRIKGKSFLLVYKILYKILNLNKKEIQQSSKNAPEKKNKMGQTISISKTCVI